MRFNLEKLTCNSHQDIINIREKNRINDFFLNFVIKCIVL